MDSFKTSYSRLCPTDAKVFRQSFMHSLNIDTTQQFYNWKNGKLKKPLTDGNRYAIEQLFEIFGISKESVFDKPNN